MFFQKHFLQYIIPTLVLIASSSLWSVGHCQEKVERDQAALDWVAPLDLQKKFPYFLSGHDEEGNPVWAFEFGKWDVRSAVEETGGVREDLTNYTRQMFERFASPELYGKYGNATTWYGVADMDGYSNRQLSSTLAVQQFFVGVRHYVGVLGKYQNNRKAFIVNANFLFQTLWNLSKPYLGQFADYTEIHGTNGDKWKPVLRKHIPKSALPEWLGGNADHKVVKVFG